MSNDPQSSPVLFNAPSPSLGRRALPAIFRRLRLIYVKCRYPHVHFGARADVRQGLILRAFPGSRVIIENECILDRSMTIEAYGTLTIGARTIFGHHCTLAACKSITIGTDCLIADMVAIRDHDHCFDRLDIPTRKQGMMTAPIILGRNVWIGSKVTIAKGVTIGDNAIVGANAVVTYDIPANAIAVGIPARVIKMRDGSPVTEPR